MPTLQLQVKKENDKEWGILARREYFGENQKLAMAKQLEETQEGWTRNSDMFTGAQFQIVPEAKQPKPRIVAPVIEEPVAPVVQTEMVFTGVKSPRTRKLRAKKSFDMGKQFKKHQAADRAAKKAAKKPTKKPTKKMKGGK